MEYYLGVDLGGTNTKFGIINQDNMLLNRLQRPTPPRPKIHRSALRKSKNNEVESILEAHKNEVINTIAMGIIEIVKTSDVDFESIRGIGVGVPGIVDEGLLSVNHLTNLGLSVLPLAEMLSKRLAEITGFQPMPIRLINDANAAALAEHRIGAGVGCRNSVTITIGTGVGGGVILNNCLHDGAGGAGEIGHMIVEMGGRKCACGGKGCLEAYSSIPALIKTADRLRSRFKTGVLNNYIELSGEIVFEGYLKEDLAARKAVKEFLDYLVTAIISINCLFMPDIIIIGGGISNLGDTLKKMIYSSLQVKTHESKIHSLPRIDIAKLKNDAGIIGAALFFREAIL